jgi:cell division protease FtsH
MSSRWLRNSFIYLLILVAVIAIVVSFFRGGDSTKNLTFSDVVAAGRDGKLKSIEISGQSLNVTLKNDTAHYKSRIGNSTDVEKVLQDNQVRIGGQSDTSVDIKYKEPSAYGDWIGLLVSFLPLVVFGAILIFMMRQAQGSNSQAMNFGKSRARMFTGNKPTVTFADVAGVDEPKEELQEVVEFLKYPEKFVSLGARIPRGVLLVGPPGTGKTLLSRAVAGEAGVPFFSISGSEFVEMFVGVGASRVRDLFDQAKRNSPCIVFVDEIDAVGRQRGAGLGGSHDEREQTLNQILVEMDGFDTNNNVIVIAATNRPDILDPALLRPGRFDRTVILDSPDRRGRQLILEVHTKGKPFEKEVDLEVLARQTPGFSGADLANLVNEAAILAARRNKKKISMSELNEAVDRVIAGPERKSRVITPREKEIIAHHEAGHALVGHMLPNADPPFKISIVARGMAGGFTRYLPDEEQLRSRSHFQDALAAALGGLVAEEILLGGESTTGPSNDLSKATNLARNMVTQWGMSERLGPRTFGNKQELVFLGREIGEQRNYSEKVAEEIDDEVRRLIDHAYQTARTLLVENKDRLDKLVKVLLDVENIEGDDLKRVLDGFDVEPPAPPAPMSPPPAPDEAVEPGEPGPQPKLGPPGLAWGGQSNFTLDSPDPNTTST